MLKIYDRLCYRPSAHIKTLSKVTKDKSSRVMIRKHTQCKDLKEVKVGNQYKGQLYKCYESNMIEKMYNTYNHYLKSSCKKTYFRDV